jgi:prepilin-type N-terminal cleavage/methylation domain-containing protein
MRIAQTSERQNGFTLVEIMIVVGIVGLLATIAVCNVFTAWDNSRLRVIQHNLGKVEAAKEQWAFDQGKPQGAPIADISELSDYFRGGRVKEVVNETYVPNALGTLAEAVLPAHVALGPYAAGASIPAP